MNLSEIQDAMSELDGWSLEGQSISRVFDFESFSGARDFLMKVAEVAESLNHHPDVVWSFKSVRLSLTTHNAKALTKIDFDLAREIDKLI